LPEWRKVTDYKGSYSAIPELGGGVHLDLIHELDYVYWLFGKPKNSLSFLKNKSSLNIESVSSALYILDYDSFYANVILNYFRRYAKRQLEIVFNEYTLNIDLLENIVRIGEKILFKSDQSMINTYKKQLAYFMQNIEKDSFNDIREAHEVLKICLNNKI
jgi:predicted dehydrogenase